MNSAHWTRRIERADHLASVYPFAAEGLRFYSRTTAIQRDLYDQFRRLSTLPTRISAERPLRDDFELSSLAPKFSGFLAAIAEISPTPVARAAAALERKTGGAWEQLLRGFWLSDLETARPDGQSDDAERLLAWIFLQPYAEFLADRREASQENGTPFSCPLCGAKPIVGVLRREGDGARKALICMLCAHEWNFRRLLCPNCGEEREPQLAFYSAPEIRHVRVDVCDTCHSYLKSVDLTKTGLAVPVVDELATLPLDLWARQHGYQKLQINILGM